MLKYLTSEEVRVLLMCTENTRLSGRVHKSIVAYLINNWYIIPADDRLSFSDHRLTLKGKRLIKELNKIVVCFIDNENKQVIDNYNYQI